MTTPLPAGADDSLQRHALYDRLDERHDDWSVETVEALFRVMRDASGTDRRDIDIVDHALLAQLVDSTGSYPNQVADVTRLVDQIAQTRLLLMPVQVERWVGLLAYSAEWKHWFVCTSRDHAPHLARVNHIQRRLSQLEIVPAHNHTRQFYALAQDDAASGVYASFYAYVMLRNIRHFPYCDEFSVCLSQELAVLDDTNRAAFVHHLRASLLPSDRVL